MANNFVISWNVNRVRILVETFRPLNVRPCSQWWFRQKNVLFKPRVQFNAMSLASNLETESPELCILIRLKPMGPYGCIHFLFQEKNSNLDRDSNLGPPDQELKALPFERSWFNWLGSKSLSWKSCYLCKALWSFNRLSNFVFSYLFIPIF